MADSDKLPKEFYAWLAAYCDCTLSREDNRKLSRLLIDSAAARKVYADYMYQHAALMDEHCQVPELADLGDLCVLEPPKKSRKPLAFAAAVVIAGIAAAVALLMAPPEPVQLPDTPEIARTPDVTPTVNEVTLIASYDAQWGNEGVREGVALPVGKPINILSGTLHMVTAEGIQLVLEGPSELQFNSTMNAELIHGRVSARVPPAGVGFTIHTAEMDVVDMGTEFGVSTGPLGSEVHVFEGRVWVAPAANAVSKELVAGDAATVRFGGTEVEAIPLSHAAFASQAADVSLPLEATGYLVTNGRDGNWQVRHPETGVWEPARVNHNPGGGALVSPTLRNTSISRWIQPDPSNLPDGKIYAYRTNLSLPSTVAGKVTLRIRHAADDLLDEIRVNGKRAWREKDNEREQPWANTDRFRELKLTIDVLPGDNQLDFLVFNGDTAYPDRDRSHTMFRAEVDAVWHREALGFVNK